MTSGLLRVSMTWGALMTRAADREQLLSGYGLQSSPCPRRLHHNETFRSIIPFSPKDNIHDTNLSEVVLLCQFYTEKLALALGCPPS